MPELHEDGKKELAEQRMFEGKKEGVSSVTKALKEMLGCDFTTQQPPKGGLYFCSST